MSAGILKTSTLALSAILAVAACASGTASRDAQGGSDSAPTPNAIDGGIPAVAEATACAPNDVAAVDHRDWVDAGGEDPALVPLVMSSTVSVGPTRFLYNITDESHRVVAAPVVLCRERLVGGRARSKQIPSGQTDARRQPPVSTNTSAPTWRSAVTG